MIDVSLPAAFVAGLVSFLAPCVLPIVPGFLAYLAGATPQEYISKRRLMVWNAMWFVIGFSLVFALLGVLLNTILSNIAYDVQVWLARVGGALIVFFGLYLIGLIRIPWFEREHKLATGKHFSSRTLTSFVFGLAFAAGWTPCVGPLLGVVLGLAASQPSSAFVLLLAYALGLGLPFLAVAAFAAQATAWIDRSLPLIQKLNVIFGCILVILGILVFTQYINRLFYPQLWPSLSFLVV